MEEVVEIAIKREKKSVEEKREEIKQKMCMRRLGDKADKCNMKREANSLTTCE